MALACLAGIAQIAQAQSLALSGRAALVCRAGLQSPAAGTSSLGQLTAFCNDPDGYEVWLDYPAALAGRTMRVDGAAAELSDSGAVRLVRASQAGSETHQLTLDGAPPAGPVTVTIRLVPINATTVAFAGP